jgi:hypothetical protein
MASMKENGFQESTARVDGVGSKPSCLLRDLRGEGF